MKLEELRPTLLQPEQVGRDDLWSLVERAADGFWVLQVAEKKLCWSQKLADLLGYTPETLADAPDVITMTHPDDRERHKAAAQASYEQREPQGVEIRLIRADGEIIHVSAWAVWHAEPGKPAHSMLGIVSDITDRVQTKQQLEASEARFRAFFDQVPAAAYIKDDNSVHLYGNPLAATFTGTTLERFIGARTDELFTPEVAAALKQADREAMTSGEKVTWVGELELPGESRPRHVWDTKFPLTGPAGEPMLGGIAIDITALHETQKQLAIAQRLESLGLMASGIAHDFNNLLFAIAGNAELAMQHVAPENRGTIRSILAATEHASALCRQLLAVGGRAESEESWLDVSEFVQESAELIEMTLQAEHPLVLQIGCGNCNVYADEAQLRQVLVNLVLNAKQASKAGSPIALGVECVDLGMLMGASGPAVHSWLPDDAGEGVRIYVQDRGRGMSVEEIERIFDPYYTDSELGHGLGLATVFGIIKAAGGAVRVDSAPHQGTRFEIFLRRVEVGTEAPVAEAVPSHEASAAAGIRRIMVIDDHAEIVAIVVAWLERLGLDVTSYTSSVLAVDVLRSRGDEFDAVITDISMPDIGGIGVLEAVRDQHPTKPVILASGYNDTAFEVSDDPRVWFLQKPYSLAELQRVIEEAGSDAG